ncbi:hypothetical protein GHK78_10140 [Sinorhizobium meliloti]|uniref:hypothetical protein n=1 Tax=Rhizobium meliloti TaxID=382 RepID=UPI0012954A9D|nr:hypothetical protein [Sinorhizobium meliloti]MDW9610840.1 hypothetical protein [Sinorhizobium meliloti]MDW9835968.1 hypothetical protein [Sinorhizobium meliloti]MDX0040343.1 hypothetical protein [Sinorhizobium meliloti]MDX0088865.1 hypothetical protein [Sinorhizobium meliloti]MQX63404.1 hypothetical protein [Sinorhizobium meliloti]
MTKHFIAISLASFVALGSVGPALASFSYYEGVDINAKSQGTSAVMKTDDRATGRIRTNAATYGFPNGAASAPRVVKGGEGEYYQGINRR